MLTLIYCSEISLNILLMLNVIYVLTSALGLQYVSINLYLRHTVLIYSVHQCGVTALKQF